MKIFKGLVEPIERLELLISSRSARCVFIRPDSSILPRTSPHKLSSAFSLGYTGTGGVCIGIRVTQILEGPFSAVSKPILRVNMRSDAFLKL